MDFNRNLRIVRTSGSSYPFPYKSNVLWVHHDDNNNPVSEIWDHGKWVPVTGVGSGSGNVIIDTKMSDSSSNAIANKTVKKYIDGVASNADEKFQTKESAAEAEQRVQSLIDTLNPGYQFMDVATPETNPGTPDQKVFYIANGKGIYTNFGGINVTEDEVVVLYWDTAWHKVSTGIASHAKLSELAEQAITIEQVQFIGSRNLLNKNDVDVAIGQYIGPSGQMYSNTGYNTSGYIKINPGVTYYMRPLGATSRSRFTAFYDGQKNFISDAYINTEEASVVAPNNAVYMRVVLTASYWGGNSQITANAEYPYSEFALSLDDEIGINNQLVKNQYPSVKSLVGGGYGVMSENSVALGGVLAITDDPLYLWKNHAISAEMQFDTFGAICIGKGYQSSYARYMRIDATNVYFIRCNSSGSEVIFSTTPHGLTISDYLHVSISIKSDGNTLQLLVNTKSGTFAKDDYSLAGICYGKTTLVAETIALSNVKLSATNNNYRHPIWIFGDSYLAFADSSRITQYLMDWGFAKDLLICQRSGGASSDLYLELERCLKYGVPNVIVWCLGMNDNAKNYAKYLSRVKAIAEKYNCKLILYKVPCTPTQDKTAIDSAVVASGLRYIDAYDAVGVDADNNNAWYSGFLATDNIHPTALGAQAIATQFIMDVPEIMQVE